MNTIDLINRSPSELGFTMPAEWERHSCCWMSWPVAHEQWRDLESTEKDYAGVANAISSFEPVKMTVDPANVERAKRLCGEGIEIVVIPNDDSWARDSGPSFLKNKAGQLAGTAWRFNAWGGSFPTYHKDAHLARRILNHVGAPAYHSSLCFEGGGLHVDGQGTLLVTESCLLNANRNYGLSKKEAEGELCRALGCEKVIWLPGDPDEITGDMTNGHVDGVACFIKPGVVLFEADVEEHGEFAELERDNRRALELATDVHGKPLEIIDMKVDHAAIEANAPGFCASYINFYIANGGIVMPCYNVPADDDVKQLLTQVFPDREVVMVNIDHIAPCGGGIHCITQQQPEV